MDEGAKLDLFGVGENLITAKSNPVFGGVYKLVAMEKDGKIIPKIKISENIEKITNFFSDNDEKRISHPVRKGVFFFANYYR